VFSTAAYEVGIPPTLRVYLVPLTNIASSPSTQTVTEHPEKVAGEDIPISVKPNGVVRAYSFNDVVRLVED